MHTMIQRNEQIPNGNLLLLGSACGDFKMYCEEERQPRITNDLCLEVIRLLEEVILSLTAHDKGAAMRNLELIDLHIFDYCA